MKCAICRDAGVLDIRIGAAIRYGVCVKAISARPCFACSPVNRARVLRGEPRERAPAPAATLKSPGTFKAAMRYATRTPAVAAVEALDSAAADPLVQAVLLRFPGATVASVKRCRTDIPLPAPPEAETA